MIHMIYRLGMDDNTVSIDIVSLVLSFDALLCKSKKDICPNVFLFINLLKFAG